MEYPENTPRRRSQTAAIVAAMSLLVGLLGTRATAQSVIDTGPPNGFFQSFGDPSEATFGQTFTAPVGASLLQSFSFYLDDGQNPDAVQFRAFVMGWDGVKASGPVLFQSGPLATTNNGGLDGYERFQVDIPGGIPLIGGGSYVAFLHALFDGVSGDANMGMIIPGSYPGGGFVHFDNGPDFSLLTTNPWMQDFFFLDMAFALVFGTAAVASEAGGDDAAEPVRVLLIVDVGAINSVFFSSIPTALAQRELALGGSRTALRDFNGRLFRLRSGTGAAPSQPVTTPDPDKVEYHSVTVGEGDGGPSSASGKGTRVVYGTVTEEAYRWQAFTSFDYGSLDMDADRHFLGLRSDTYAESAGVEYAITRHVVLGTGVAWLQSDADRGTDVEGITLAAYASAMWRGFYADLLYGATLLDHDIDRNTGTGSTAHAEPGSVTHAVNFNAGHNFRLGSWVTGPFAGVDYAHAKIDGYTESGGRTAATRVSDQSTDSLIARVGWQASRPFACSWGTITPQVRVGWERENLGSDDELAVSLLRSPYYLVSGSSVRSTGRGFSARVSGQDRERDYFTVGAGVLAQMGRRFHLLLDYEGNLLDGGYAAHFGKISLGWRF
jgi:uncharacterized protein YhjY with autotransporter beta-barrel domain